MFGIRRLVAAGRERLEAVIKNSELTGELADNDDVSKGNFPTVAPFQPLHPQVRVACEAMRDQRGTGGSPGGQ